LSCDGAAPVLLHEVEDSLAVLGLAAMLLVLVLREVSVVQEVSLAQLAHQGAAEERQGREFSESVSVDVDAGYILRHTIG